MLQFLQRGVSDIVRMRGLPYDATAQQVLAFFAEGDSPIFVVREFFRIIRLKLVPMGRPTLCGEKNIFERFFLEKFPDLI